MSEEAIQHIAYFPVAMRRAAYNTLELLCEPVQPDSNGSGRLPGAACRTAATQILALRQIRKNTTPDFGAA